MKKIEDLCKDMDYHKFTDIEIKYKKNGEPNKHSLQRRENADRSAEILEKYFNDIRYSYHHVAMATGNISRKEGYIINDYKGRYGEGVSIDIPFFGENNLFHPRYFFILRGKEKQ